VHKINPDMQLVCKLYLPVNVFTAAYRLCDANSHCFSNQRIRFRANSLISVTLQNNI